MRLAAVRVEGGRHVGFDVEVAQRLAQLAFGKKNRVSFTCVTTPEREAALTSGRADLVIATFSYTPDRDTRIDFSRAYYKATGRLLVRRGSSVQSLADLPGARVATTTASIYDRWLEKCFPTAQRVTTDTFTGAEPLALEAGRCGSCGTTRRSSTSQARTAAR